MRAVRRCRLQLDMVAVLLALLLAGTATGLRAQQQAAEAPLKAAILVNLLMFVDWPQWGQQAADRLSLCYLTPSAMSAALDELAGKRLKNRPLTVGRVELSGAGRCHALYLSKDDADQVPRLASGLKFSGTLVLADTPGFFPQGVMFNLALDAGRIVFDVDLQAARRAGLVISSKVLRLARHIQDQE